MTIKMRLSNAPCMRIFMFLSPKRKLKQIPAQLKGKNCRCVNPHFRKCITCRVRCTCLNYALIKRHAVQQQLIENKKNEYNYGTPSPLLTEYERYRVAHGRPFIFVLPEQRLSDSTESSDDDSDCTLTVSSSESEDDESHEFVFETTM